MDHIDIDNYDLDTVEGHDQWVDAMQAHNGHNLVLARTVGMLEDRDETWRAVTVECVTCTLDVALIDTRHVYGEET